MCSPWDSREICYLLNFREIYYLRDFREIAFCGSLARCAFYMALGRCAIGLQGDVLSKELLSWLKLRFSVNKGYFSLPVNK